MDAFFLISGLAMLIHMALCAVASRAITSPGLKTELFAVPNRLLGTPPAIRLMRVRYYWPFSSLPDEARALEPSVRAVLLAARATGLCFLCAILGFLGAAFVEAGS